MDTSAHTINSLFSQLGLPDDSAGVDAFIQRHHPLPREMPLAEAPFWTAAQRHFIEEAFIEDSDWVEVVDELDARLRN